MSKELRELIIAQVRIIGADDNAMFFPDTYADRIMQLLETTPAKEKRELADKMIGCLPEKNSITKLSGNSRFDQQVTSEVDGFNQAIDQIRVAMDKIIKELE